MTEHGIRWLWNRWIDLWNGDLDQASEIIHPEFTLDLLQQLGVILAG